MRRPTTLIVFLLAILTGGILFSVAYKVSALEEELTTLNKKIKYSRDNTHVLKAEWSSLNQAERLQDLSHRLLELKPLQGKQFSKLASLPMREKDNSNKENLLELKSGKSNPAFSTKLPEMSNIRPKPKPLAPIQVSNELKLASQSNSISLGSSKLTSEKNKLDAVLREIFSKNSFHTAGSAQ